MKNLQVEHGCPHVLWLQLVIQPSTRQHDPPGRGQDGVGVGVQRGGNGGDPVLVPLQSTAERKRLRHNQGALQERIAAGAGRLQGGLQT